MDNKIDNILFDIVVCVGPNDNDIVEKVLPYTKKNVIGYRNIYLVCSNPNISEKVFDIIIASDIFLADRIDWDALCRNDNISEEFFFYYSNKINWTSICYNKNISPNFFELFIDRVDWNNIHNSPNLTANFIYKHLDKMVYI